MGRIVVNRDSFRELRFGGVWVLWESKAMQRKRDGLVPIGEVIGGLGGGSRKKN